MRDAPISISVTLSGHTYEGEYVLDHADDGYTYVIVICDGFGTRQKHLGQLDPKWLAKDVLRELIRGKQFN